MMLIHTQMAQAQVILGLKGGATLSNINYLNKFNQKTFFQEYHLGFSGGLSFQYFHPKNLGLQADFLYIQKGFKSRFDENTGIQYERNIDYLSIPFLMNVYIGQKSFSINLLLGLYGSYAISSQETLRDGNNVNNRKYQFSNAIDNRLDMGLQGGLGLRKIFKFGILQAEGQFAYGLISLFKWDVSNPDPEKDKYFEIPEQAQNQSLMFTLSYLYVFSPGTAKD